MKEQIERIKKTTTMALFAMSLILFNACEQENIIPQRSAEEITSLETGSNTESNFASIPLTALNDFPGVRREYSVGFSINNKGYLGTGYNFTNGDFLNDFWEYDPLTDTWTQKADFAGGPRSSAVAFSVGGKGYIGTGEGKAIGPGLFDTKDLWEYNPALNTWTKRSDLPGSVREGAIGFSCGSKGYIGTGSTFNGPGGFIFLQDFWQYDPATDTWSQVSDFPGTPRTRATSFVIGSNAYVGLGFTHVSGSVAYHQDFWKYNPNADPEWIQIPSYPSSGRYTAMAFSRLGIGYVGLGITSTYATRDTQIWSYDPSVNNWNWVGDYSSNSNLADFTTFTIRSEAFVCSDQKVFKYN